MEYKEFIDKAIKAFWDIRISQKRTNRTERDNRGAVLGGRQMDGFVEMMKQIALSIGIPSACVFTKGNIVPGYYRASKNWDFLVVAPNGKLIALVEFKSQIGSYGNNFNNRSEEAIGTAVDFWTAFRENQFPGQQAPWVGYLMLVGRDEDSIRPVHNPACHFPLLPEFDNASYMERYRILCRKLILERNYTSVALSWTSRDASYGDVSEDLSIGRFLRSFEGYLKGALHEFQ